VQVLFRPETGTTRETGVPGYTQADFKGFMGMRTQDLWMRHAQKMKNPATCL